MHFGGEVMVARRAALLFGAAILLSVSAAHVEAATLEGLQGVVLVDRGGGYGAVQGPTQLNPGDSVIANPGGSASVVYPDGCKVPVVPGSVVAVGSQSPCSMETGAVENQALGGLFGFNTTTLLIGGVVVAGAVAGIILLTDDDDEKPASP